MKSVKEYNLALKPFNHRIFAFQTEGQATSRDNIAVFSLVKLSGKGNYFERLLGLDIEDTVYSSGNFSRICKEAEAIIESHTTKARGVK